MNERDIFIAALQQVARTQRQEYLDEACGGDEPLRRSVEALLEVHERAGSFLQEPMLVHVGAEASPPATADRSATVALISGDRAASATAIVPVDPAAIEGAALPVVPGYEILGELGRGGVGVVYKARQLSLNRLVALKMVLAGSHAGTFDLARFHTEAEAVAQLEHPHIVHIHEVGKAGGLPFLSLEYLAGGNLAQKLGGVPQLPPTAAALVETLARAVHHAHQHGIVHRDLKPSNVLLGADGTPKVADFGLAKRTGTTMTQTGAILGTPSYMAPEQAAGKKDVGPAADVYALGALLYEMLTGRPPFQAPTPLDTMMQVVADEPVPPRRLQPKLPHDMETICLKCLQKEPAKRYASAQELADDLARFLADRPIVARPVSRLEHGWRWCRRNRIVATLSVLGVVGVVVAALLLYQERSRTLKNLARAEEAEQERTEQLWKSYRDQAEARRSSRQVGQRFASLKALAEAARIARLLHKGDDVFEDLRRKAIGSLALPDLRLDGELPGWPPDTVAYALADTFERYALRDKHGTISVRRVADRQEIRRLSATKAGAGVMALRLSPDGRYLATDTPEGQLKVWDLERKQPALVVAARISGVYGFSPDSRRLVFSHEGAFGVCDLPSGRLERRWQGSLAGCGSVVFHPDGHQFAALFPRQGLLQFWSVDSGRLLGDLPGLGSVRAASWDPYGRLLAVTNHREDTQPIHLWDVPTRGQIGLLEGHKNSGVVAVFNPTGALIASNGWEWMLRLWDPRTRRQLLSMPASGYPRFNRRGDRLLTDGASQIWEVADGREYRTFVGDPVRGKKVPSEGSISPDGRFLAAGNADGVMIWEMATGKELAYMRTGRIWHVLFQPSGDLLTSGQAGLLRWPLRPIPGAKGEYRLGPPQRLVADATDGVAQSKDGRTLVVAVSGQGGQVVNLDQPGVNKPLLVHAGTNKVSVSPDGRWAATGCFHGTGIKVWSVSRNKLERELPIAGLATPYFSPDGRWLATVGAGGLQRWKVDTWERGPALAPEGHPEFAPDGRLVAVRANAVITLVNLDSGRRLATLEDPNQDRAGGACFSPDGTLLAVSTLDSFSIHVWDLRRLRAGLKEINLDWEAPPYPAPSAATDGPLKIRVAGAELLDPITKAEYQRGKAAFDLFVNPFDADAHLRVGTFLLEAGQLESGHAHLTAALAFGPYLPRTSGQQVRAAFRLSGTAYARRKCWQKAAADYVRLAGWEPQQSELSMQAAALLLVSGDRPGYCRLGQQMLARFRNTTNPFEADQTAKTCLIAGDCEKDQEALARLAEVALKKGWSAPGALPYFQFCRGLSEYRQGRYAFAREWFARSRTTNAARETPISSMIALNGLFEAMSLHQLGHTKEARRSLATAVVVIDNFGLDAGGHRGDWHDWLFCQVAREEAEAVLKGTPKPGRD